jgi:hypothetical protein
MGNNKGFRKPFLNFTLKLKMSLVIIDVRAIVKKEEDNNFQKMVIFVTFFN